MPQVTRRSFLLGTASMFVAAPARASSTMPPTETLEPICFTNLKSHRFMAKEYAPFVSRAEAELCAARGLIEDIDYDVARHHRATYPWHCLVVRKSKGRCTSRWEKIAIEAAHYPHGRELESTPLRDAARAGDAEAIEILERLIQNR